MLCSRSMMTGYCIFYFIVVIAIFQFLRPINGKVAIAIDGSVDKLIEWVKMFQLSNSLNQSEFNLDQHTHLFLASSDKSVPGSKCRVPGVTCTQTKGNNTWVSLRNKQAISIYQHELKEGKEFKYWLFSDAKMLNMTCKAYRNSTQSLRSIQCLSRYIHFLLTRASYAQVYITPSISRRENEIVDIYCGSHLFHAIHRAAVPLLLPYVEFQEKNRTVDSQAFISMIGDRCTNDHNVALGMLGFSKRISRELVFEPNVTSAELREKVLSRIYTKIGFKKTFFTYQQAPFLDMCARLSQSFKLTNRHINSSLAWRSTSNYHLCLRKLKPYFIDFVTNGNIKKIT